MRNPLRKSRSENNCLNPKNNWMGKVSVALTPTLDPSDERNDPRILFSINPLLNYLPYSLS